MAEAIEIANAYIALTTKMPGVKKDIESALGDVDSGGTGNSVGKKFMGGVKGGALAVAAVAGAAVVGTLGVALTKGFSRLTGIDNATAKMKGLGFTADETQGLMDNALESVKGTAFGLDSAAGVAAQLAASGIGPGEKMAGILSTVANSAAAAGGSMDEMGSIFAKAATQANGVQNDVISQIADRGIPIYQALADQMGVTAGEVFKMASEGKVDFETFAAAAESAAGGVAEAMGGTVQGSMQNLTASLGRAGAGLLGGVFDELAPTIQAATKAMGPLEDIAADLGKQIGEFLAPGFEFLRDLLDGGFDFSQFAELLSYFSPLQLAFQVLQPVLPMIMDTLGQVFQILGDAAGQILPVLLPVLSQIVAVFAEFMSEVLPPLMPLIIQLAELVSDVLLAVLPLLDPLLQLVEAIFPVLAAVIDALMPYIGGLVDAIGSLLMPIVDGLVDTLDGLITFLTGVFTGDWEMAWQGVQDIFAGIWNTIVGIGEGAINGLIDIVNGLLGTINTVGGWLSDITGGAVDFTIGEIPHVDFGAAKFAAGGIVPSSNGGTLGIVGEAGRDEAIIPLPDDWRSNGLAGLGSDGPLVQVDVHGAPGMDETVIGQTAGASAAYQLSMVG